MTNLNKHIIEITKNISTNTTFYKNNIYVIVGEIHVLENITLIVENDTAIYIRNGSFLGSKLRKSAFIFDTGSRLLASNIYFVSSDINNNPTIIPDNGGVWFCGSVNAVKEGISSKYSAVQSYFEALKINAYYLGSKDLIQQNIQNEPSQDNDGITILGCINNEWNVNSIYIQESGDNAIDLIDSYVTMDELIVLNPGEDSVNLQSSKLNINKTLILLVPLTNVYDRDIFDLETDNGPSFIKIEQNCYVEILGIFGDETKLVSNDLQQPTEFLYYYKGFTEKGQSYIYSDILD
jgi:hypothetical protein